MASCSYIPRNKEGEELTGFQDYRKALGYTTARDVFFKAMSPRFQSDYSRYLEYDEQHVPTYASIITVPYIKNFIGTQKLADAAQKAYVWVPNTRDGYERLVSEANNFNTSSPQRDTLTAIVEESDDNSQIRVQIVEKNEKNDNIASSQYGVMQLNNKLADIFSDLGVTVELLEQHEAEKTDGRVDFNHAVLMADGFESLIKIANNAEGVNALPEEFSHLIIGVFRNQPIVSRSLDILNNNTDLVKEILGNDYQAVYDSYEGQDARDMLIAEEALGRVLQESLLQPQERKNTDNSSTFNRLIARLVNWIKNTFRSYDINDVVKAKQEVINSMHQLSSDFLNGKKTITKEDIANSKRNAVLNHTKEEVNSILKLIQKALDTERKRLKISSDNDKDLRQKTKQRISSLSGYLNDTDKLEGLMSYAKWALEDLTQVNEMLDNVGTTEGSARYRNLIFIKNVIDSYAGFVHDFRKTLDQNKDAQVVEINGTEVDMADLWRRLDEQFQSAQSRYESEVIPAFIAFVSPIYEASPMRDKNGNIIPLERIFRTATKEDIDNGNILNEDVDINFLDKMCIPLANSRSIIGQLFDRVVKEARNTVREQTKDNVREIWVLREKAEQRGITSFEWMFEKDKNGKKTGYYISEYNIGQFEQDYQEMIESLNKKYGDSPFGEDQKKYMAERRAWLESHAKSIFGNPEPNDTYLNPEFKKLNKGQRDTLNEFLDYKASLEIGLPKHRVMREKAIQRRRSSVQRFIDTVKDPESAVKNIKEEWQQLFDVSHKDDDDRLYGSSSGLTDFTGKEFMTLPLLYTSKLRNPDELSTDVFSDLMMYAYSVNEYKALDAVVDPLKLGREAAKQKRLLKTKLGKVMQETINDNGTKIKSPVYLDETQNNLLTKIDEFFESQVYGRYMKPQGDSKIDKNKWVTVVKKFTSSAYLGANYLAGIANVATAVGMQNVEAFAKEWFSAKELLVADKEYTKMFPEFFAEIGNRVKQSKMALFGELFNIKQDYREKVGKTQKKNYLQRIFGNNLAFIQQNIGDHWIYYRTAIAMAKHEKVKYNGRTVSVWDVLETITDPTTGKKKMQVKEGVKNLDGTDFSKKLFEDKVAHVIQTLVGNYNQEDLIAAKRTAEGRLLFQMRDWIVPPMMRRFQGKRTLLATGKEEEGFYRTFGRFAIDLCKASFNVKAEWDNLNAEERANVLRATAELAQWFALFALVNFVNWGGDDPDRIWALQFAEYMANRELHELGFFVPSPTMVQEVVKTVQSPVVAASAIADINKVLVVSMIPKNWSEEVESGAYKGHSRVTASVLKSPLPPVMWYKQINKIYEELDAGTRFYARDYR